MTETTLRNRIGDERDPSTGRWLDVTDPSSGQVVARCPDSGPAEVADAVRVAAEGAARWRAAGTMARVEALLAFRASLAAHLDELGDLIVTESGKTRADAAGELRRGLQYIDHGCAGAELLKGEHSPDLSPGIDTWYVREPLGVFALVAPFNFPAMIPLYFGWAVVAGNAVVLKPSELCPLTADRLVALAHEAGILRDVLTTVHGGRPVVEALVRHPDVAGVTFVGSSPAAKAVYEAATSAGKRAQCQGGSNNHLYVDASADLDRFMPNLISACFGQAGQRCFAGSNLLVHDGVGDAFLTRFVDAAAELAVGPGRGPDTDVGPVISAAARDRLTAAVDAAVGDGAKLLLDGRNATVPQYAGGFYLGPTILETAPGTPAFDEELFGPVRCVHRVAGVSDALAALNRSAHGHSAVVYAQDLSVIRRFVNEAVSGQIGVNVGTPAPIAFYPVGGRRSSFYGDLRGRARDAIDFYTDKKVVVQSY